MPGRDSCHFEYCRAVATAHGRFCWYGSYGSVCRMVKHCQLRQFPVMTVTAVVLCNETPITGGHCQHLPPGQIPRRWVHCVKSSCTHVQLCMYMLTSKATTHAVMAWQHMRQSTAHKRTLKHSGFAVSPFGSLQFLPLRQSGVAHSPLNVKRIIIHIQNKEGGQSGSSSCHTPTHTRGALYSHVLKSCYGALVKPTTGLWTRPDQLRL